jgi:hypothetical protein
MMANDANTPNGNGDLLTYPIDCDQLDVSPQMVQRYFGGSRYVAQDHTKQKISAGIEKAKQLARPKGAIFLCRIKAHTPNSRFLLDGGGTLTCPSESFSEDTTGVAAALITLGSGLERYCRHQAAQGAIFDSVLLDAVGTALLESCDSFCCELLTAEARRRGLFAGARYAPGMGGYPLSAQRELFSLLAPDRIGVRLNDAYIMSPVKSLTHLTILTSAQTAMTAAYKCHQCDRKQCQFRISTPPP